MDALLFVSFIIALFVGFDLLAYRFGVDSREGLGDDHVRRAGF